jgi:hypothetical protein
MTKMVTENGIATLTPDAGETHTVRRSIRRERGRVLWGTAAQYAVEALGQRQALFIDGTEYGLAELRLRVVDGQA